MGGPADLAMSLALGTIIIVLGIGYAALFWGSMVGELMAMAALVGAIRFSPASAASAWG